MRAKIVYFASGTENRPVTPNLKLECDVVFEDETGKKYYVPDWYDYIKKLGNRRSPAESKGFGDIAQVGDICDISFEDFSGDLIVTDIDWSELVK